MRPVIRDHFTMKEFSLNPLIRIVQIKKEGRKGERERERENAKR